MVSSCRFSAVCSMTPSRYLRHSRKLASQYLSYEKFLYFIHLFFPPPPSIFAVNFGYISIDLSRIFFLNRFIRRKSKTGIESQLKYRLTTDQLIFFFFQVAHRIPTYIQIDSESLSRVGNVFKKNNSLCLDTYQLTIYIYRITFRIDYTEMQNWWRSRWVDII